MYKKKFDGLLETDCKKMFGEGVDHKAVVTYLGIDEWRSNDNSKSLFWFIWFVLKADGVTSSDVGNSHVLSN